MGEAGELKPGQRVACYGPAQCRRVSYANGIKATVIYSGVDSWGKPFVNVKFDDISHIDEGKSDNCLTFHRKQLRLLKPCANPRRRIWVPGYQVDEILASDMTKQVAASAHKVVGNDMEFIEVKRRG